MGKNRARPYQNPTEFASGLLIDVAQSQATVKERLLRSIDQSDVPSAKGLIDELSDWHEFETSIRLFLASRTQQTQPEVINLNIEQAEIEPPTASLESPSSDSAGLSEAEARTEPPEPGPETLEVPMPEPPQPELELPSVDVSLLRIQTSRECFEGGALGGYEAVKKMGFGLAYLKQRLCLAHACLAAERIPSEADRFRGIIKSLVKEWRRQGKSDAIFPATCPKGLDPQVLINFSGAYDYAMRAMITHGFASSAPTISQQDRIGLLDRCAAACACVRRMHNECGILPLDAEVEDLASTLHKRLDELRRASGSKPIAWWKTEGEGGPKNDLTWASASGIEDAMNAAMKTMVRSTSRITSLNGLVDLVTGPTDPTFAEDLPRRILECIENGVGPTEKKLIEIATPYRQLLQSSEEAADPRFARLLRKIGEFDRKVDLRVMEVDEIADQSSDELEIKLSSLNDHLRNKTLLLIGGNKSRETRRQAIEKALGCAVDWPVIEEYAHLDKLEPHMLRADVVCMLVRWSRHSYKIVLDEAKRLGKQVAMLPRGTGVNTVVNDLYQQLLAGEEPLRKAV